MGLTVGGFPLKTANLKFDDAIAQLVSGEDLPSLQTVLEKIDQRLDLTKTNLTALLELYVDPVLGSDSPDKGAATGVDAYASLNYALAEVHRKFNPNGNIIRINISAGTHIFDQQTILIELSGSDANFCDVVIRGVTAAETIIQCNTPNIPLFISRTSSTRYCFRALTFEGLVNGSSHILELREGSYADVNFCNVKGTFPNINLGTLVVSTNASLRVGSLNYGDLTASALIYGGNSGKIDMSGYINALDGTNSNFTEGFLHLRSASMFKGANANFIGNGTVTGKKYVIDENVDFEFVGETIADLNQIPGDQPGEFIAVAQYAIAKYGEDVYYDYSLGTNGMVLARDISSDGLGVNFTNVTGEMRRYNGAPQTATTAFASLTGKIITNVEFSCTNNVSGRTMEIRHYDLNGNDEQLLSVVPINQQNNRLGGFSNVKLYVPQFRRLVFFMVDTFDDPQLYYNFRKVLQVL